MATDDSLRYGLAPPHGPNTTGRHVATADPMAGLSSSDNMNQNEKEIFNHILRPDDSYDSNGTYWADMGLIKRARFTSSVDNAEARKELGQIGRMIKRDPLSPLGWYVRNAIIPGAGLLMEGYVLFSVGNITTLLNQSFASCWDPPAGTTPICNKTWVQSLTYLETAGIIVGQLLVGILGDWFGRRYGLIQDAVIMSIGLFMLVAAWGVTQNGWVICYAWSLFFYSVGVGGEYPMTATAAMENAVGSGRISTREDRLHRGRKVTSAFLMQGWGQFLNQAILIILLLILNDSGSGPYSEKTSQWVYRLSFVPPLVGTLWLVYYRVYKMRSANKTLLANKAKSSVTGYDRESLKLTIRYFGGRIFATASAWFANDIFFYGNKLFQGQFIKVITNNSRSVGISWNWNLLNVGVELVGYYLASFLIDNKLYGRKWMMIVGFVGCFICFTIPAFDYAYYSSAAGIHKFQTMYFLSSFFNQFGPNSVTFIVAAEVFPTPIRASAHGFSAAWGKLGALTAAILYNYITVEQRFYVVPWFGLAGAIITYVFLPDTTGLDLKEQERRWGFIRSGREHEYHGVAVHPKHLSLWERLFRVGKHYDPEADYQQKIHELRGEWEEAQARKAQEGVDGDDQDTEFSSDISTYFERTGNGSYKGGSPSNGSYNEKA